MANPETRTISAGQGRTSTLLLKTSTRGKGLIKQRTDIFLYGGQNLSSLPTLPKKQSENLMTKRLADKIKLQLTTHRPKFDHAGHQTDAINQMFHTDFDEWDDKQNLFSVDFGLVKDLNNIEIYRGIKSDFEIDLLVTLAIGAIDNSNRKGLFGSDMELFQEYKIAQFSLNGYWYPLRKGKLLDPFIGAGVIYTFLEHKTRIKIDHPLYHNEIDLDYNDSFPGLRVSAGLSLSLGNLSPALRSWGLALMGTYCWNRSRGSANAHMSENLRILGKKFDVDIQGNTNGELGKRERIDIDLSGPTISIVLTYRPRSWRDLFLFK